MEKKQLFLQIQKIQSERWLKRLLEGRKTEACAQFVPVSYSLLDNPKFRNLLMTKKRFRTYLWLRRHVVRGPNLYDPCDIFQNYWSNGELATSLKLDKIAKDLGLSKSTVSDHIRQLENDAILIVDAVSASEAPNGKAHRVFILGTCVGGQERWLIDDVFNGVNKNSN